MEGIDLVVDHEPIDAKQYSTTFRALKSEVTKELRTEPMNGIPRTFHQFMWLWLFMLTFFHTINVTALIPLQRRAFSVSNFAKSKRFMPLPLNPLNSGQYNNYREGSMKMVVEDVMSRLSLDDATCPFRSRFYPRQNSIPFHRSKNSSAQHKFWLPGQRSLIKYRFMNRLQRMSLSNCTVEWRDDIVETEPYSSVATLAALWYTVANSFSMPTTKVIALPDANANVIEQWVRLMNWFIEQQNTTIPYTMNISFSSTVVDFITIPTVLLSCVPLNSPQNASLIESSVLHAGDETIIRRTKSWTQRILVDHSICPFTRSVTYSGQGLSDVNVPVGRIAYHVSSSVPSSSSYLPAMCQLQSDTWNAIYDMLQAGPAYSMKKNLNGISSILLAAPGWDDHFTLWSGSVFSLLEAGVVIADATEKIGVVCFHPLYQTPDGRSFPGFGHMHSVLRLHQWLTQYDQPLDIQNAILNSLPDLIESKIIEDDGNDSTINIQNQNIATAVAAAGGAWQRRTPHATINVLRADQLAAAEGKRSTPKLYANNIVRLSEIGWKQLASALDHERHLL